MHLSAALIIIIMTMTGKEDNESLSADKRDFSKDIQEMISLIMGYFPHSKPSVSSHSDVLITWFDVFGKTRFHSPCFLSIFDKLKAISGEVDKKFCQTVEDKKKAPAALPSWDQVYCLGDHENFCKVPKVNESFSCLLNKKVSSSRSLSLSLDKSAKLEACVRGQIESQSFSLWILASIFKFLKESNCVP